MKDLFKEIGTGLVSILFIIGFIFISPGIIATKLTMGTIDPEVGKIIWYKNPLYGFSLLFWIVVYLLFSVA